MDRAVNGTVANNFVFFLFFCPLKGPIISDFALTVPLSTDRDTSIIFKYSIDICLQTLVLCMSLFFTNCGKNCKTWWLM